MLFAFDQPTMIIIIIIIIIMIMLIVVVDSFDSLRFRNGVSLPTTGKRTAATALSAHAVVAIQLAPSSSSLSLPSAVPLGFNAYLLPASDLAALDAAALLWCQEWTRDFKLAPDVHALLQSEESDSFPIALLLSLMCATEQPPLLPDDWPTIAGIDVDDNQPCFATVRVHSIAAIYALADMSRVLWIDRHRPAVRATVREAARVLQSFFLEPAPADSNLFHAAGIDGTGQIVNIVDGGLATAPCFFNESAAFAFDAFNASARKLVYYATTFGDRLATSDGHGTAMASIAAGSAPSTAASPLADEANRYRGLAYNARIAFTDIEKADTGRKVPTDFSLLWQSALFVGARIFSHSFSDNVTAYTETDRQIDSFVSQNPTVVAVASAGNGGTIAWDAKNVLIVGSSRNDRTSRALVLGNERFLLYVNNRFSFEMAGVRCNRGRTVFDNSTLTGRLIFNAARPTGCVDSDLAGVDVFGRTVMVDRGGCPDEQKLRVLERLGARAAVLVHNETSALSYTASGLASLSIFTWAITKTNGDFVKQRIAAGDDVRLYVRFDINRQRTAEANVDASVVSSLLEPRTARRRPPGAAHCRRRRVAARHQRPARVVRLQRVHVSHRHEWRHRTGRWRCSIGAPVFSPTASYPSGARDRVAEALAERRARARRDDWRRHVPIAA
jgi:hypothetical protein